MDPQIRYVIRLTYPDGTSELALDGDKLIDHELHSAVNIASDINRMSRTAEASVEPAPAKEIK